MEKVLNLYKKEGETPLETIERFKMDNSEYSREKMTYAGRLDPMAEGVLIVLVGDECKNKDKYLGLDKEYEFEILWGVDTDTYDILGIPKIHGSLASVDFGDEFVKVVTNMKGRFFQKYPAYSSKTVEGKQMFQIAREGKIGEIEIPEREVEIYNFEYLGNYELREKELLENITKRILKVKGDFRQKEILEEWNKKIPKPGFGKFVISKFKVSCSSGTYVRGIVNELGKKLGVGATTFGIKRVRVGEYM
jgi:tRNA pseudouridine55 synthase